MRFEVLMALLVRILEFWDVMLSLYMDSFFLIKCGE
jgi:hypothetical protein